MTKLLPLIFVFALFVCYSAGKAVAQTTEFTYQGSLKDSASPANANYDFEFALYDAASGGSQMGATLARNVVSVTNGIFAVKLDFGNQFQGASRFLEIRVRQSGSGGFTTLSPRQPLNSSPYSVKSLSADSATTAVNFTGPLTGDVTGPQNATALANNAVTTAKLADSAVTAAKIAGGQAVKGVTVGGATLTDNVTLTPGSNITITPTGNTLTIASTSGGVGGTGSPNSIPLWNGGTTLGNSVITQSASGNLGIGTSTPLSKLVVNAGGTGGQVNFGTPSGESGMAIIGTNRADVRFDGETLKLLAGTGPGAMASTNGINVDRFGRVGIGTEVPYSKLSVEGSGVFDGTGAASFEIYNTTAFKGYLQNVTDSGAWQIANTTSGTTRMLIDPSGTVSIYGNVTQPLTSNGLVKAMIAYGGGGTIDSCYNSTLTGTAATTAPCGFSVSLVPGETNGAYNVNFGFSLANRFFSVTPRLFATSPKILITANYFVQNNLLRVDMANTSNLSPAGGPFMVIVY